MTADRVFRSAGAVYPPVLLSALPCASLLSQRQPCFLRPVRSASPLPRHRTCLPLSFRPDLADHPDEERCRNRGPDEKIEHGAKTNPGDRPPAVGRNGVRSEGRVHRAAPVQPIALLQRCRLRPVRKDGSSRHGRTRKTGLVAERPARCGVDRPVRGAWSLGVLSDFVIAAGGRRALLGTVMCSVPFLAGHGQARAVAGDPVLARRLGPVECDV